VSHRFCEGKEFLHRIGPVLHVSATKNLILKAENIPSIGDRVTNEKLNPVGIVSDVFGPTSSPYVSVKSQIKDPSQLTKHILYAVPSKDRRKKRKKR
jgi:rRNA processing protein Gar1